MEDHELKRCYNLLDPARVLEPGSELYVDIDGYGSPDQRPRGISLCERLTRKFRFANGTLNEFITGLPGSGKSTELWRIARSLEEEHGFCVARIDAQDVLDITAPIDLSEMLAALVHRTERRVLELEGKDPETSLQTGYLTRLWEWLSNTDLVLKGARVGAAARTDLGPDAMKLHVDSSAQLDVELKTRPVLREKFREAVSANFSRFLQEVREYLDDLRRRVIACNRTDLVVIFDGLEKLQGTFESQAKIVASAEHVFVNGRQYLRNLPVHTVFTIPMYLLSRAANLEPWLVPMIKLSSRNGERFDPGFEVAREIVRRRMPDQNLKEVLGDKYEDRLEKIIASSGGFPRDILRSLRELLLGDLPASDVAVARTLNGIRDSMRNIILTEHHAWLARVAVHKSREVSDENERNAANAMLTYSIVLGYLNSEEWWDVHPLVREIPDLRAAIELEQKHRPVV